jgi:hypothetical protein
MAYLIYIAVCAVKVFLIGLKRAVAGRASKLVPAKQMWGDGE